MLASLWHVSAFKHVEQTGSMLGDVLTARFFETFQKPPVIVVAASLAVHGIAAWVHSGNSMRWVNCFGKVPIVVGALL